MGTPNTSPGIGPARLSRLHTWLLSTATHQGHRLLGEQLATMGLRAQHYLVLVTVEELGNATQADISRALGVDTANMVTLLGDLERQDCIERSPDPKHRRRNI